MQKNFFFYNYAQYLCKYIIHIFLEWYAEEYPERWKRLKKRD